jgi:hypothetical protein
MELLKGSIFFKYRHIKTFRPIPFIDLYCNVLATIHCSVRLKKENPSKGKDLNLINIEVKYP